MHTTYTMSETSSAEYNETKRRALELSLQYNFVTELTSLIVVADKNFTVDNDGSDGQNLVMDQALVPALTALTASPPSVPQVPAGPPGLPIHEGMVLLVIKLIQG